MSRKLESATSSVKIAQSWEAKNQAAWVVRCLDSALMNYVSIAVCEKHSEAQGIHWLRENRVDELLRWHWSSTTKVLADISSGRLPGSVLGGAFGQLVFSHLSTLLQIPGLEKSYAELACDENVVEITGLFWNAYAKCLKALLKREKVEVVLGTLKGQEIYWSSYILLMSDARSGGSIESALEVVDRSFADRNRDSSIPDDNYEIEGTAQTPARWDLRKAALLKIIRPL